MKFSYFLKRTIKAKNICMTKVGNKEQAHQLSVVCKKKENCPQYNKRAANEFLYMFQSILPNSVARLILKLNWFRKVLTSFVRSLACKQGGVFVNGVCKDGQRVNVNDRGQSGN